MPADKQHEREKLLDLLVNLSFKFGTFKLTSGLQSEYYIDCRTTTLHAEGGRLVGIVMHDLIRKTFPTAEAIGGLAMGANPVVANIASASGRARFAAGSDCEASLMHGFFIGKEQRPNRTNRVEGFMKPGAPVVIVDDVCSKGGSTIEAIKAVRAADMRILGVACIFDRGQGGKELIETELGDAPFMSIFNSEDIQKVRARLTSN